MTFKEVIHEVTGYPSVTREIVGEGRMWESLYIGPMLVSREDITERNDRSFVNRLEKTKKYRVTIIEA